MPDTNLSILMIASEAVPFAKTGGLADVMGALPAALARLGHEVTVVIPRYRAAAGEIAAEEEVTLGSKALRPRFLRHQVEPRLTAILVDAPELYDRDALYGIGNDDYKDNAFRFAFLTKAALQFAARHIERVDVVHAHDWQAGLAPVYLKTLFAADKVIGRAASVLTIHNLAYQGLFSSATLPTLDLGWQLFNVEGLEYWGKVSFLKAGVNFSEMVTTVSPGYAKEIQTAEYGFGFDGILRRRSKNLMGILNGIDVDEWNPAADPALPKPFDMSDLSGKTKAKRALLEAYGLTADKASLSRPLVGLVARMVDQKGFDLLSDCIADLVRENATYVLLGSGDPRYEQQWRELAGIHPTKVGVYIGFDNRLAHLIEGGADIFLMPSRFEPCGLNQMYSLRYGTVPVVRATGGLDDTVENYKPKTGDGTGFKFTGYTGRALIRALRSAFQVYGEPRRWRALQLSAMKQDHSWAASARKYVEVYRRASRAQA